MRNLLTLGIAAMLAGCAATMPPIHRGMTLDDLNAKIDQERSGAYVEEIHETEDRTIIRYCVPGGFYLRPFFGRVDEFVTVYADRSTRKIVGVGRRRDWNMQ